MKRILSLFVAVLLLGSLAKAQGITPVTQYPYHMGFEFYDEDSNCFDNGWDVYTSAQSETRWYVDTSIMPHHDGRSSMYISTFNIFSENYVEYDEGINAGVYSAYFIVPENLDAYKFRLWIQLVKIDLQDSMEGELEIMIGKNTTDFNYLYTIGVEAFKDREWTDLTIDNIDLWGGSAPFDISEGDTIYFLFNLNKTAEQKGRYILIIDDFEATATFCNETNYPYHDGFESLGNCWTTEAWAIEAGGSEGYVCAASWPNLYGTRLNREHGLTSPAIALPNVSNGETLKLTFDMAAYRLASASNEINENYALYVSTDPANFGSAKLSGTLRLVDSNFRQFSYDLTDFAGKTIYLQFTHKTGDNGALMLDNIRIQTYNADGTSGIGGIADHAISVFPNPTRNSVSVNGVTVNQLQVLDMAGRVVSSVEKANTIDMSHLTNGVYILRILAIEGTSVRKVVKK